GCRSSPRPSRSRARRRPRWRSASALALRRGRATQRAGAGARRPWRPEDELHAADVDRVALGEFLLGHALAVDERAVLRAEILDRVTARDRLDLAMLARDAGVRQADAVFIRPADPVDHRE